MQRKMVSFPLKAPAKVSTDANMATWQPQGSRFGGWISSWYLGGFLDAARNHSLQPTVEMLLPSTVHDLGYTSIGKRDCGRIWTSQWVPEKEKMPNYREGGKLEKLYPAKRQAENFAFPKLGRWGTGVYIYIFFFNTDINKFHLRLLIVN